jgi:hypothetical protein
MAKSGYQAVALDPAVAKQLRGVAHYLSVVSTKRVSMSEALEQLVSTWAYQQQLPDYVLRAILGAPEHPGQVTIDDAQS